MENGVNVTSERPGSFAVDDPHLQDAVFAALGQVVDHQLFHVARAKGVEIEHTVKWQVSTARGRRMLRSRYGRQI